MSSAYSQPAAVEVYDASTGAPIAPPVHALAQAGVNGGPSTVDALVRLLASLASGVLADRKAELLTTGIVVAGLAKDPARFREIAARNDYALDAYVDAIDWPAVAELVTTSARSQRPGLLACATDPAAGLPLVIAGALGGYLLAQLLD
jgi:hypothetical protein